jgi:hypothetical protein
MGAKHEYAIAQGFYETLTLFPLTLVLARAIMQMNYFLGLPTARVTLGGANNQSS